MIIYNAHQLVDKAVFDSYGNNIGIIDKVWQSWNYESPGYFFGLRPTENIRYTYFRGTTKLIPIYSDYIREVGPQIILNKTLNELSHFWNKTIQVGVFTYPTEELIEKPIFDKNYSRVGTFYAWVENDGTMRNYGCFLDPYLCYTWNIPYNMLFPVPINSIFHVRDTITLDKTLNELKEYWRSTYNWNPTFQF